MQRKELRDKTVLSPRSASQQADLSAYSVNLALLGKWRTEPLLHGFYSALSYHVAAYGTIRSLRGFSQAPVAELLGLLR